MVSGASGCRALKAVVTSMSLISSTMGSLWMVSSRGVMWSDLGSKKEPYRERLKEHMGILLGWVPAGDDDGLDWEGGHGD